MTKSPTMKELARLHAEAAKCLGQLSLALERGAMGRATMLATVNALEVVAKKLKEVANA